MQFKTTSVVTTAVRLVSLVILFGNGFSAQAQAPSPSQASAQSRLAPAIAPALPRSTEYAQVQQRLARGWNTWDVHSVATQVLLPEGLAIHVGLKHNTGEWGDAFLKDALIGRLEPGAEVVTPGPHTWDGSYTELRIEWKGHIWQIQSAHAGDDLVLLVTPLTSKPASALPPTIVFSVDFLWNRPGATLKHGNFIEASTGQKVVPVYCACTVSSETGNNDVNVPVAGSFFAIDLVKPVGVSTGERRELTQIQLIIDRERAAYQRAIAADQNAPILDAIETTLGWDTNYEPEKERVVSPVSRVWSVNWGGYVIFDWDTFFAATMASIGSKDLAYADAIETLRESTSLGFVPNYGRAGNWKSSDRSEPPVGAMTVLGLYRKFHDRWFLRDAFEPLLRWNRWWSEHRDMQGYIVLGSDPDNQPINIDDTARGTWQGAVYESGLDNSPMYDGTFYNKDTHLLEYADVGMTALYIADCDALAEIADALSKPSEAKELRDRSARYRARLATLWDEKTGIFLNKDLHTGQFNKRLSPTNFYPMLAHAATPEQAAAMVKKHLMNPDEFWGKWIIPSIAFTDPAFKDQNYWRGRIWGPMNYLVYLGLQNYADTEVRKQFAQKSYDLFLKEWRENGHVHENYNAIQGTGDDVQNSDRFYHWGALLGYVQYLEQEAR